MENDINVLLTIIIPTKNRYTTLFPVLRALLDNIEGNNFEIVVQDNSLQNNLALDFQEEVKDNRLKYFYCPDDISIVDNTIKAIENSRGRYLTFIGDDDLISPYILDIVKYIDEKGINCLVYNAAYYWWSNVDFEKETFYHRKKALWLPTNPSLSLFKLQSHQELNMTLQSGAGVFSKLPKFYHGIVTRAVLEAIKERTGTYLPGSSPDIAFSTSIALVVKDYYHVNYPLSVFGASQNSGGGMTARKKHYGEIKDQKFLPKNIMEVWNKFIPLVWSEKSIYAQSVTEVLNSFDVKDEFNYVVFYATMLAYEPYLISYIMPAIRSYCGSNLMLYSKILMVFLKKKAGILYRRLKFMTKTYDYDLVLANDVDEVMKTLKTYKMDVNLLTLKN